MAYEDADLLNHDIREGFNSDFMSKLVYVAAPFSAPTLGGIEENITTAKKLGRLLLQGSGSYPVVPHVMTADMLDDNIPEERDIALRMTMDVMLAVQKSDGFMVILVDKDGTTKSRGVAAEIARWKESDPGMEKMFFVTADVLDGVEPMPERFLSCPQCGYPD